MLSTCMRARGSEPLSSASPDVRAQRFQKLRIHALLFGRHRRVEGLLVLLRQILEHLGFQAAHEKRLDALLQFLGVLAAAVTPQERRLPAQIARQNEIEDAPQLAHVVFHRRARKRDAHLRVDLLGGRRADGLRVFHELRLVQDREAELLPRISSISRRSSG